MPLGLVTKSNPEQTTSNTTLLHLSVDLHALLSGLTLHSDGHRVFTANHCNFREHTFLLAALLYAAFLSNRWLWYKLTVCWNKWCVVRPSHTSKNRKERVQQSCLPRSVTLQLAWFRNVAYISFNLKVSIKVGGKLGEKPLAWLFWGEFQVRIVILTGDISVQVEENRRCFWTLEGGLGVVWRLAD